MSTIQIQRIIDTVSQEISNKDSTDRYNIERSESNLALLLQQCIIELADDSKQFVKKSARLLANSQLATEALLDEDWKDLSGGENVGESVFHELTHPIRYLRLRSLYVNNIPAVEAGMQDFGTSEVSYVFETTATGWKIAAWIPSKEAYQAIQPGAAVSIEYYTYPDITGQTVFEAHPLSENALIHLMLHNLQSRDPFIEFGNGQLQNGQFNHASWHKSKYSELAARIFDMSMASSQKTTSMIKPNFI